MSKITPGPSRPTWPSSKRPPTPMASSMRRSPPVMAGANWSPALSSLRKAAGCWPLTAAPTPCCLPLRRPPARQSVGCAARESSSCSQMSNETDAPDPNPAACTGAGVKVIRMKPKPPQYQSWNEYVSEVVRGMPRKTVAAAGYLNADEAQAAIEVKRSLAELTDDELIGELERRLKATATPATRDVSARLAPPDNRFQRGKDQP